MEDEKKYILQTYARAPLVLTHGSGARVVDTEGKEYVDMAAGIGEQDYLKHSTRGEGGNNNGSGKEIEAPERMWTWLQAPVMEGDRL